MFSLPDSLSLDSRSDFYAMAYGLVGFSYRSAKGTVRKTTSLRVRIRRIDGDDVWVRTADTRDAGTDLVLSRSQVEPEIEW